jgi:formylglycine-generating enzyme required for sulfatase activity
MVVIPAGEFTMGSPPSEMEAEAQHRVTIAYPFAVGKFTITFDEWQVCLKDGGCEVTCRTTRDGDVAGVR